MLGALPRNLPLALSLEADLVRGELAERLANVDKGANAPLVVLRADRGLDYGRVVSVMGELNAAGFKSVSLVTNGSAPAQ